MESGDAAEGIFERESSGCKTFHLILYLAKAGLQGSSAVRRHTLEEGGRDETRGRGREMKCNEWEREKGPDKKIHPCLSNMNNLFMLLPTPEQRE